MPSAPDQPRRETIHFEGGHPPFDPIRWTSTLANGLNAFFDSDPGVVVATGLSWVPLEDNPAIQVIPDLMVVFGRPRLRRGIYQQWNEANMAPQVIFELLSPLENLTQVARQFAFYDRYGVEEYYLYDPIGEDLCGWLRYEDRLEVIDPIEGWTSPRLGLRFALTDGELELYKPDGQKLGTYEEIERQRSLALQQLEQERQRADLERLRAERLAEQLRLMGIDPEAF